MTSPGIPVDPLTALCERCGVDSLALHGQVIRGALPPGAPVEVLVEFSGDVHRPEIGHMEHELSILYGGRPIRITVSNDLKPFHRDRILQDARVLYRKL